MNNNLLSIIKKNYDIQNPLMQIYHYLKSHNNLKSLMLYFNLFFHLYISSKEIFISITKIASISLKLNPKKITNFKIEIFRYFSSY